MLASNNRKRTESWLELTLSMQALGITPSVLDKTKLNVLAFFDTALGRNVQTHII